MGCAPTPMLLQFPGEVNLPYLLLCPCSLSQVTPAVLVQKTWMSFTFTAVRKEETKWRHGNGSGSLPKENKALTKEIIQGYVFTQSINHGRK